MFNNISMKRLMMIPFCILLIAGCLQTGTAPDKASEPALMSWDDLTSRPLPEPSATLSYGAHGAQLVDIWLPDQTGPYPVVLMVHGGCWQKEIADRTLMNYAAEDLRARGIAVWNIEYRGVDEPGGGYPGTFEDVAAATDFLAASSDIYNLDTDNVVAFGHSAGGHLVAWLAGRANLPETSPLSSSSAIELKAIVNSGGLADLEASEPVTLESCLSDIIDDLTGEATSERPDVFSDTSPVTFAPGKALQISVNGRQDRISPPSLGQAYTQSVIERGGRADFVDIEDSGHVELISPGTRAFDRQAELIEAILAE